MLSILIVNWNTKDKLLACLESIYRYPPTQGFEVIVVDNASSDGSLEAVLNLYPQVICIDPGKNTGYAKGNNLAFEKAKGDYLLTLNPDTEFFDDCLDRTLKKLSDLKGYGSVGIRLIDPTGITQKSVRGFPSFMGVIGQLTGFDRAFPKSKFSTYSLPRFDYHTSQPAPQPMGTFLLFKRSSLEKISLSPVLLQPFDESFPIFFNDVDLMKRLHDAGEPCWYEASCGVFHHHGSSTSQVKKAMIWESHKSLYRYWAKHVTGIRRVMLPFVGIALVLAAFLRAKGYDAGFRS